MTHRCTRIKIIKILVTAVLTACSGCTTADRIATEPGISLAYLLPDIEINLALAAGPEHLRADATVYIFGTTGYTKIRSGKNGITCLVNRDGHQHGDSVLRPTCWDAEGSATILPVVLRVGELIAQSATAADINHDIERRFQIKQFISPRKAGIAYMLSGDVIYDFQTQTVSKTTFPAHYMIYAPGVSNADIGTTDEALQKNPSLPLIYNGYSGGSRTGYIIIMAPDAGMHTLH